MDEGAVFVYRYRIENMLHEKIAFTLVSRFFSIFDTQTLCEESCRVLLHELGMGWESYEAGAFFQIA